MQFAVNTVYFVAVQYLGDSGTLRIYVNGNFASSSVVSVR
jgi:hypothetical protein